MLARWFCRSLGLLGLVVLGGGALPAAAASPSPSFASGQTLPFGAGERAEYQVRLGGIGVGRGALRVLGIEEVQGHPTLHTQLQIQGGIPFARVNDTFDSWIDIRGLFARRFWQDQHEVRFRRRRQYDFFPESRSYRRSDTGETGALPTHRPLDDVSFLYFARTLSLEVGETHILPHYFKEDGNPVILKVLRRETVRVPAGTFQTVVVRPIIRTKGLFAEGGEAEVYFTDDARRIPVLLRSKVPLIGSLTLHLTSYQAGTRGAVSSPGAEGR